MVDENVNENKFIISQRNIDKLSQLHIRMNENKSCDGRCYRSTRHTHGVRVSATGSARNRNEINGKNERKTS